MNDVCGMDDIESQTDLLNRRQDFRRPVGLSLSLASFHVMANCRTVEQFHTQHEQRFRLVEIENASDVRVREVAGDTAFLQKAILHATAGS